MIVTDAVTDAVADFVGSATDVALKATVAATSVMAAEKMWKNGNRLGAIGVMVASNVAMGFVAANNARVLARVRQGQAGITEVLQSPRGTASKLNRQFLPKSIRIT